jgi:uncharacterized protein (DUF433 family)
MAIATLFKWGSIISCDPEIMGGTPVFAGTRVPVRSLIDHLRSGDSLNDFLDGFPSVTHDQAVAFLELALQAILAEIEYACAA